MPIADRKIVEACPWLGLRIGDPVLISHRLFHEYQNYLWDYVVTIAKRLSAHFSSREPAVSPSALANSEGQVMLKENALTPTPDEKAR
jgi:hypothetical protein